MSNDDTAFMDWATQHFQEEDAAPNTSVDNLPSADEILDARMGRLPEERVREIIQKTLECPVCAELWRLADSSFIEDIKQSEESARDSLVESATQQEQSGALLSLREFKPNRKQIHSEDSQDPSRPSRAPANSWSRWSWIGATAAAAIALVVVLRPEEPQPDRTLRGGSGSASQRLGKEFQFEKGIFRWPIQASAAYYRLEVVDDALKPVFQVSKLTSGKYETTPEQRRALEALSSFYWSMTTVDKKGQSSVSPTFRASMKSSK